MYHIMWQSHTQYQHVPKWNKKPAGQFGDTGISFGHAVSKDLAHWKQVSNSVWPDEWFTSVSVYDGSATLLNGIPTIIAAGLTPNTTSVFCHAKAIPANLSDPNLEDWVWDKEPMYCGNSTNNLHPFDAPSSAWKTALGQWQYTDGRGGVYVSDDGQTFRGGKGKFPGGTVVDFFPLPRVCDGCGSEGAASAFSGDMPTHVWEAANTYSLFHHTEGAKDEAGTLDPVKGNGATVMNAASLGYSYKCDHGSFGFPKSFDDPVKKRRIHYGWVQGPGFQGQEDAMLDELTYKVNHQSLLREITFDPRLGQLNFFPVEEMKLLRGDVLAQITAATAVPTAGVLLLKTLPNAANQSEIRVTFAMPTTGNVTFGVRVMTTGGDEEDEAMMTTGGDEEDEAMMTGGDEEDEAMMTIGGSALTLGAESTSAGTAGAVEDSGTPTRQDTREELFAKDPFVTANGTDLVGADVAGLDFKFPKGTTDSAGIAQCQAFCANHSQCGAYIFVSESGPTPGGPRCAIKQVGVCKTTKRGGCFSGYKKNDCAPTPAPPHPNPGFAFTVDFVPAPAGATAWAVGVNGGKLALLKTVSVY
jgi:hypothetical protein